MQVRNGNDKNFVRANLIDYSVWKPVHAVAPCTRPKRMPRVRKIGDLAEAPIEFVKKLFPKTFSSRLIPRASVLGLGESRGLDAHLHDLRW